VDTFRAADLDADEHLGQYLRTEGADGVIRALRRLDDLVVDVVLDRPPWHVTLPAGRPVEVTSP
jgi:hypothetical protein